MGLNPRKGDMYHFIDYTWNVVKGKCEHDCSYCYMKKFKSSANPRFDDSEFKTDMLEHIRIFVGSSCDMFAENISSEWIKQILDYCERENRRNIMNKLRKNRYFFQSKNPARFLEFVDHPLLKESAVCTTLESNRFYSEFMGNTPQIEDRVKAMEMIDNITKQITIEPIMRFDLYEFVEQIKRCNPIQVNIGANSWDKVNLPEPTTEEVIALIRELLQFTKVYAKDNLERMVDKTTLLNLKKEFGDKIVFRY